MEQIYRGNILVKRTAGGTIEQWNKFTEATF